MEDILIQEGEEEIPRVEDPIIFILKRLDNILESLKQEQIV